MKSTTLNMSYNKSEPQRLTFTTASLQNTVLSTASDAIYYEIVTPKWEPTTTRVSKMDPRTHDLEVVAELQNDVSGGGGGGGMTGDGAVADDDEKEDLRRKIKRLGKGAGKNDAKHRTVRLRGQQFRPTGEFWTNDGVASVARFRGKDGKFYQWRVRKGRPEVRQRVVIHISF
jgi:hypothetical protein